jgi:hypothetical protein
LQPKVKLPDLIVLGAVAAASLLFLAIVSQHAIEEPELTVYPWLVAHGFHFYYDIIDQHTPLIPMLLAVPVVLRHGAPPGYLSVQLEVVLVNALTGILLLVAGTRLVNRYVGLLAVGIFLLIGAQVGDSYLWYDNFLPLFTLPPLFLLPDRSWRAVTLAGLSLGLGILAKQHVVVFAALYGVWWLALAWPHLWPKALGLFGGIALPLVASVLFFAAQGHLNDYLYWAFLYNLTPIYSSQAALFPDWNDVWNQCLAWSSIVLFPLIARRVAVRGALWLLPALVLAGCVPAYPRFGLLHLLPAAPFVSLMMAVVLYFAVERLFHSPGRIGRARAGAVLFFVLALALFAQQTSFHAQQITAILQADPQTAQALRGPEMIEVTRRAQQYLTPRGTVLVLGDNYVLNLLINHLPPKPFALWLPWLWDENLKQRLLNELHTNPPDLIIIFRISRPGRLAFAASVVSDIEKNYRRAEFARLWGTVDFLVKQK